MYGKLTTLGLLGLTIGVGVITPLVMNEIMELILRKGPTVWILRSFDSLSAPIIVTLFYTEKAVTSLLQALAAGIPLGIIWGFMRWRYLAVYFGTVVAVYVIHFTPENYGPQYPLSALVSAKFGLFALWIFPSIWSGTKVRRYLAGSAIE